MTPGAWLLCSPALTRVWASCDHSVQLPRLALWGSPIGHPLWSMFDLGLPSPASAAWAFPRAHRRPSCAPGFVHRVAIESSSLWSSQPLRGGSLSAVTPSAPVSAFVDSGLQSGVFCSTVSLRPASSRWGCPPFGCASDRAPGPSLPSSPWTPPVPPRRACGLLFGLLRLGPCGSLWLPRLTPGHAGAHPPVFARAPAPLACPL